MVCVALQGGTTAEMCGQFSERHLGGSCCPRGGGHRNLVMQGAGAGEGQGAEGAAVTGFGWVRGARAGLPGCADVCSVISTDSPQLLCPTVCVTSAVCIILRVL